MSSAPMSPGPCVTATRSTPSRPFPASDSASRTTGDTSSRWRREATSGTTPPYLACRFAWEDTTDESSSPSWVTTAAAVSSHEVSSARITRPSRRLHRRRRLPPHDQRVLPIQRGGTRGSPTSPLLRRWRPARRHLGSRRAKPGSAPRAQRRHKRDANEPLRLAHDAFTVGAGSRHMINASSRFSVGEPVVPHEPPPSALATRSTTSGLPPGQARLRPSSAAPPQARRE